MIVKVYGECRQMAHCIRMFIIVGMLLSINFSTAIFLSLSLSALDFLSIESDDGELCIHTASW